ncbi:hypothetical protein FHW69_000547 [Luteibacter sp. Sphag1AF]|uniref:hypothetical protein n=1 Tax=Luteibacter sp. Sphag1AF TaxID=2587031 RepID=UPI00161A6200|nr:hypothetical protein [Luteibacter sp. Sphag1AF]MBB3225957.1 hypothetical protein [Luteibacter sp. Sphag1AF]
MKSARSFGQENPYPAFSDHNFSAYCFSTMGCRVFYHGKYDVDDREGKESSALVDEAQLKKLHAVRVGIRNFPPPALVTWQSKDGIHHEAEVDLGRIFKDRRIVHNVDKHAILEGAAVLNPDIILVVNDRTISVYMKAFIPLKSREDPANKYSDARDELVLAYRKLY